LQACMLFNMMLCFRHNDVSRFTRNDEMFAIKH